jgi:predicted RNase H-like HicB family nuclease
MAKYVYPAIIENDNDGYSVEFPNFEYAHTCGKTLTEALSMAEDCLGLVLYNLEQEKKGFPKASSIANYENKKNKFATLINIDYTEYKRRVDEKPIRKTLYIPKNLNDQAEAMSINFSELLRTALKQRVNA